MSGGNIWGKRICCVCIWCKEGKKGGCLFMDVIVGGFGGGGLLNGLCTLDSWSNNRIGFVMYRTLFVGYVFD